MPHDLFISYAHQSDSGSRGAVAALVARLHLELKADFRRRFSRDLEIFFDKEDIKDFDHWQVRCHRALRDSRFFIACLSRTYLRSDACRWEWEEWCRHELKHGLVGQGAASLWFVKLEELEAPEDFAILRRWRGDLLQRFRIECHELRDQNSSDILDLSAHIAVRQLTEHVAQQLKMHALNRARRGNLPWPNDKFVGRKQELSSLRAALLEAPEPSVVGIHGLGGMGKTALSNAFAYREADAFPGGCWLLRCEGRHQLLTVLRTLVLELELALTEAERLDDTMAVKRVFEVLRARGRTLFILDNVDHPELLEPRQTNLMVDQLWARVLFTTRLSPNDFTSAGAKIRSFGESDENTFGPLTENQAVELIRRYQPEQEFSSTQQEAAAREIVRELGGLPLAVETAAVYLGQCDPRASEPQYAVEASSYLYKLREDLRAGGAKGSINQLREVTATLRPTLTRLDEQSRTVLHIAALLPADLLPLPWLRNIVGNFYAPLAADSSIATHDEWTHLIRTLVGMRLLNSTSNPSVLTMHRLLQRALEAEVFDKRDEVSDAIDKLLSERSKAISENMNAHAEWELDALVLAVPARLKLGFRDGISPRYGLLQGAPFFTDKIITNRTLRAAKDFLTPVRDSILILAERYPHHWEKKRLLATCLQRLGEICEMEADIANAQHHFIECQSILNDFATNNPGDLDIERSLAIILNRTGDIAAKQGDLEQASSLYSDAANVAQRLVGIRHMDDYHHYLFVRLLALSKGRLGAVAHIRGDISAASEHFTHARDIAQGLVEVDPSNADWQKSLAIYLINLGSIALSQSNTAEASRHYHRAKEVAQALAGADPSNADWKRGLAISLNNLGDLAASQGNCEVALRRYSEALDIAERLAATDPNNSESQTCLAVILNNLLKIVASQGDSAAVSRHRLKAESLTQQIKGQLPQRIAWQDDAKISPQRELTLREIFQSKSRDWYADGERPGTVSQGDRQLRKPAVKLPLPDNPRLGEKVSLVVSLQGIRAPAPKQYGWKREVELLLKARRAEDALEVLRPILFAGGTQSMNHSAPFDARILYLHALMLAQNCGELEEYIAEIPEQDHPRIRALRTLLVQWKSGFTWRQRLGLSVKPPLPSPPQLD